MTESSVSSMPGRASGGAAVARLIPSSRLTLASSQEFVGRVRTYPDVDAANPCVCRLAYLPGPSPNPPAVRHVLRTTGRPFAFAISAYLLP